MSGVILICRPGIEGELSPFSEVELKWAGAGGILDLRKHRGILAKLLIVLAAKAKYDLVRGKAPNKSGFILERELVNFGISGPYSSLHDHLSGLAKSGYDSKYRKISKKLNLLDGIYYKTILCHYPLSPSRNPNRVWFLNIEPEDVWIAIRRREGVYKREVLFDVLGGRLENPFDVPIEESRSREEEREEKEKRLLAKFFRGKLPSERRRLSIIAKAFEKAAEGRRKSRPPSLQKLSQDYKKRIVDNRHGLWFPYLRKQEVSAPYLERTAVPANDAARERYFGPQKVAELITRENAIILLGDPGSGKSYTTARLAVKCAEGQLLPEYFPVYASLPRFSTAGELSGLCEKAINEIRGVDEGSHQTDFCDSLLAPEARTLLIFDALDEVHGEQTREIVNQLGYWLHRGNTKVIVTCRTYEYRDAFAQTPVFSLTELTDDQIIAYLQGFLSDSDANAEPIFKSQIKRDERILRMAQDPFMLSKMAFLLAADKSRQLPRNHGELLNAFIEELPRLKAEETRRRPGAVFHAEKNKCLEIIAYDMIDKQEDVTNYTFEHANNAVRKQTPAFPIDRLLEQAFHDRFLKRGSYLYPRDPIEFSHELFKEAFAGRRIRDLISGRTLKQKRQILLKHLDWVKWDDVFVLLVGMLDQQDSVLALKMSVDYVPILGGRAYLTTRYRDSRLEQSLVENLEMRSVDFMPNAAVELLEELGTDEARAALARETPLYADLDYAIPGEKRRQLMQLLSLGTGASFDVLLDMLTSQEMTRNIKSLIIKFVLDKGPLESMAKCIILAQEKGQEVFPDVVLTMARTLVQTSSDPANTNNQRSSAFPSSFYLFERFFGTIVRDRRAQVFNLLDSRDQRKQDAAAYALFVSPEPALVTVLEKRLNPISSRRARMFAAGALLKMGSRIGLSFLLDAVGGPDQHQSEFAIRVLTEVHTPESRHILIEALGSVASDPDKVYAIGRSLWAPENAEEYAIVKSLYDKSSDDEIRPQLLGLLCHSRMPDVVSDLYDIMRIPPATGFFPIFRRLAESPCEEFFERIGDYLVGQLPKLKNIPQRDLIYGRFVPLDQLMDALCHSNSSLSAQGVEIVEKKLGCSLVELVHNLRSESKGGTYLDALDGWRPSWRPSGTSANSKAQS